MNTRIIAVSIGLLLLQAAILFAFGQPPICRCGYVNVWEGVVQGSGNSQHLTDWYTFSHIIHGFLFYLLLWFFFPRMPVRYRLIFALGLEAGWEVIENTPWLIEHYREQALAQGYTGDSIINSVSDSLAMIAGFLLAARLPVVLTLALGFSFELFTGVIIRDGLTFNILNLFYIFPFIARWQGGA